MSRFRLVPLLALVAGITPLVAQTPRHAPHEFGFQASVFPMNGLPALGATARVSHLVGAAQRVTLDGYLTLVPAYDHPSPGLQIFGLSATYAPLPERRVNPVLVAGFGIMHVDAAQGASCLVPPCPSGDPNFHPAWEQTALVGGGLSMRIRPGVWLRGDARLHIPIAPEDIDRASGNPRPEIALGFMSRF